MRSSSLLVFVFFRWLTRRNTVVIVARWIVARSPRPVATKNSMAMNQIRCRSRSAVSGTLGIVAELLEIVLRGFRCLVRSRFDLLCCALC